MSAQASSYTPITGVFPVLPTPFDDAGALDVTGLRTLVRYLLVCGVDGITYPGVASEVGKLSIAERLEMMAVVQAEVAGRVPVIAGVSAGDAATTTILAKAAVAGGCTALMIAAPPERPTAPAQIAWFSAVAAAVPGATLMLQNVPPPVGAGLDPQVLIEVLSAVPAIRYIKEETLPSGQRLTAVLAGAPASLAGVFGGAGGRYITDELRRGAAGTMPAIELAEVHVALVAAHRAGDAARVRQLFTRMLPVLNVQAVFRWSLTKYVLNKRGLISGMTQRMAGPVLDELDRADVDAFLGDIEDLLLPPGALPGAAS
ncbi:MAG: dihydrodipicolinate synthase family protein [Burkholderiales bacterium]|nr:dihydrodipicolinate synthase family protein [Burkholderiales bacterium]